jgi:hypothetical protein
LLQLAPILVPRWDGVLEKVWLMLEELVQQGAQSGREAVLFVVILEEEVADGAAVGTAPKFFIHQRLREDRLAAARICRDPEQVISRTIFPALVRRVRQSPLASLLNTIGVNVFELLVCAGLKDLVTTLMFFVKISHYLVLKMFSRRVRVRFQHICRGS